jgi:hypothetical protein
MSHGLFRRLRRYVAALPPLVFGFMGSPALSATIDASGFSVGQVSANFSNATVTSTGGSFTKIQSVGSSSSMVVGVNTGFVASEADTDGEKFTINFSSGGAVITEITLGLLFREGEWGVAVNEQALLKPNTGTCNTANCLLSADGTFRGLTTGVTTLSQGIEGQGGIFRIANPFGSTTITSLDLSAFDAGGSGSTASSFGLVSVVYTTIPEPNTFVLVGLGAIALAVRRRQLAKAA